MRRVRDFLKRFGGIQVSAGSVRNVLHEAGLADPPPAGRAKRKASLPRRFERARPGELWQSDITSYVLRRHATRVYLTVFLDDFSRYVVSWQLATQQRGELVQEALLEGIARFGKPVEVLTDQGRQYFSWRGKSRFQKLLVREGIRHVVSRTHHPQTLGKCERLWKTVGEELWERARPQDLAEARERLGHFFAHYNHFRPHQGIDGLVPADRFFGAEDALRRTLEAQMSERELDLALSEAPRRPVFLFGQIGDRAVSLHGERGRLVIHTESGGREELALDGLGMAPARESHDEEHGERDVEHGGSTRDGGSGAGGATPASQTDGPQAGGLPAADACGPGGAGPLEPGERRGAHESAQALHGDPRVLAGPQVEGGSGGELGTAAGARVAAQPAGALGDARGSLAPAAPSGEGRGGPRGPGDRPQALTSADRGAGDEARQDGRPGARAEAPAVDEGGAGWSAGAPDRGERVENEGQGARESGARSAFGSWGKSAEER
jgi:transposase InsO family protein